VEGGERLPCLGAGHPSEDAAGAVGRVLRDRALQVSDQDWVAVLARFEAMTHRERFRFWTAATAGGQDQAAECVRIHYHLSHLVVRTYYEVLARVRGEGSV